MGWYILVGQEILKEVYSFIMKEIKIHSGASHARMELSQSVSGSWLLGIYFSNSQTTFWRDHQLFHCYRWDDPMYSQPSDFTFIHLSLQFLALSFLESFGLKTVYTTIIICPSVFPPGVYLPIDKALPTLWATSGTDVYISPPAIGTLLYSIWSIQHGGMIITLPRSWKSTPARNIGTVLML